MKRLMALMLGLLLAAGSAAAEITCEGEYPMHLQGVAADAEGLVWSFTTRLVRTDFEGRKLVEVAVPNHHGDLCCREGKVYVAVCLGRFNRPNPPGKNFIYEYDAATLKLVTRHPADELQYGAGGIAFGNGVFCGVGGLPEGEKANLVVEYTPDFKFSRKIEIPGYTRMGVQTVCFLNDRWLFGIYDKPELRVYATADYAPLPTVEPAAPGGRINYSCGMTVLPDGRFAAAVTTKRCTPEGKTLHGAKLVTFTRDAEGRLVRE